MGGINEVVDRVCKLIVPGSEVLTIIMCCINIMQPVYEQNESILEYCQLGEDVLWSTIMEMRVYIYMRFRL